MITRTHLGLLFALMLVGCASGQEPATRSTSEPTTTAPTPTPTTRASAMSMAPSSASASADPTSPAVAIDDTCRSDADCTLENVSEDTCCSTCGDRAMTNSRAAALHAKCASPRKDKAGAALECPSLDCPYQPVTPVCDGGRCAARPRLMPKS
ncbi:MAG: hypothetical protein U0414_00360 [Polyangiaceae bacterium]